MKHKQLVSFSIIIIILLVIIFSISVVRHLEIFNIKNVDTNLETVPSGVYRIINPLKGENIFTVNSEKIETELDNLHFVNSAEVTKQFPSTLSVIIDLADLSNIIICDGVYYIPYGMYEIDESETMLLENSAVIEINSSYLERLKVNGLDIGFENLLSYLETLESMNYLITNVKYDNNRGESFGTAIIDFPDLHTELWIREKVSADRLISGLEVIKKETVSKDRILRFDLYSDALVKRL